MTTPIPAGLKILGFFIGAGLLLLCSCSTMATRNVPADSSVRQVDFRAAPEMKIFAGRVRQVGDEMYPRICALLAESNSTFPRQFDVCFKQHLARGQYGEAEITQIRLSAAAYQEFTNNPAFLDALLVHEMAHVAQHYFRPLLGGWLVVHHHPPPCWTEGMADYVCFKLAQTNGLRCPECGYQYPDYRSGYSCAGAFLLYLESHYDSNIVRQLNQTLRFGGYSDRFFAQTTGRELPALWAEFQHTAAFTPVAARMLQLEQSLGYANGQPPRNIKKRFRALVEKQADPVMKEMLKSAHVLGNEMDDIQGHLAVYLYLAQPGGSAEAFLFNNEGLPPGFAHGDQVSLDFVLGEPDLDQIFPVTRSLTLTRKGDSSSYHYTVFRASADGPWKLQRAWRTTSAGGVEEYPVP